MGIFKVFKTYSRTFWASNVIELFERWAWYALYMALALYLVNSKDTGALGFSHAQKSLIMGTGSMLLYLLPIITGSIADKVGYKKILFLSFAIYISGFFMLRSFHSFGLAFFSFIWICIGGAFFKPIISAMVARTTTEKTASIGFGIFYMIVNIGGFIGPFIGGIVMKAGWDYLFFMSMAVIGFNYLITIFFFKEPIQREDKSPLLPQILQAFKNIGITLKNWRYVIFLLIMSLFWAAFNQLYYSFPIFVEEWVNTSGIYQAIASVWSSFANAIGDGHGGISTVTFSSMDAFFIICFQLFVSAAVMRFRPLHAMMGGILILAVGLTTMFSFQNGWMVLLGVLVFSIGEMSSSPKYTEYIGRIAPSDQKALYMGTSFLPIALGNQIAAWLSGGIYEGISDKLFLLQKEVEKAGLKLPDISDSFTKNDYITAAAQKMQLSNTELTDLLWTNYHPQNIWIIYAGVAVAALLLLYIYDHYILPQKNNNE